MHCFRGAQCHHDINGDSNLHHSVKIASARFLHCIVIIFPFSLFFGSGSLSPDHIQAPPPRRGQRASTPIIWDQDPAPVLESATFPRSLSLFYWRMVFRTWDLGTRHAYATGVLQLQGPLGGQSLEMYVCILTRMYPHTCNSFRPICIYQGKHEFILTGLTNPAQVLRLCSFFFNPVVSGFFPLSSAQDWVAFMIYVQVHWIFYISNLLLRPCSKYFIELLVFK